MIASLLITAGVGVVLALLLAPVEALRWWAVQGVRESRASALALEEASSAHLQTSREQEEVTAGPTSYMIYLSGVGANSHKVSTKGEQPLLDAVQAEVSDVLLISDVYPYSPSNRPLTSGRWSSWWWRLVDRFGRGKFTSSLQLLVYFRNALQFAVSADDRYGPVYALGVARVIRQRLLDAGYRPGSNQPVVLFGWSGGAQIALSTAWYLAGLGIPTYLLSLGGVLTSDPGLDRVRCVWHLQGSRDITPHLGSLFPGRWPGRRNTFWARAVAEGRIQVHDVGPMHHMGRRSYLSRSRLPDGRICREVIAETIVRILREAGMSATQPADPAKD